MSDGVKLIRVKRKHDEEPMDALVVQAKHRIVSHQGRRRQIFRRVGTVKNSSQLEKGASRLSLLSKIQELSGSRSVVPPVKAALSMHGSVASSREKTKKTTDEARKISREKVRDRIRSGDASMNASKQPEPSSAGDNSTTFKFFDILQPGGEQCEQRKFKRAKSRKTPSADPFASSTSEARVSLKIVPEAKPGESISDLMCNFVPMMKSKLSMNDEAAPAEPMEVPELPQSDDGFVYDLYYSEAAKQEVADWFCDGAVEVTGYDDFAEDEEMSDSDVSEDSNAENYWGNEYPDTDQFTSEDSELDSSDEVTYESQMYIKYQKRTTAPRVEGPNDKSSLNFLSSPQITRMEQADFTEKLGSRWTAYKAKAEVFLNDGIDFQPSSSAIVYDGNSDSDGEMDY